MHLPQYAFFTLHVFFFKSSLMVKAVVSSFHCYIISHSINGTEYIFPFRIKVYVEIFSFFHYEQNCCGHVCTFVPGHVWQACREYPRCGVVVGWGVHLN